MHIRPLLIFLFLLLTFAPGLRAQEITSTWPFAEKIGWRGLQVNFGAAVCNNAPFSSAEGLKKLANPDHHSQIDAAFGKRGIDLADGHKFLQVLGVFVPFRNARSRWISKTEWQSGLEFQLARSNQEHFTNPYMGSLEYRNRSLLWKNRLLFQQKFFSPNIKVYLGPTVSISMLPQYSFTMGKWAPNSKQESPTYSEQYLLNRARLMLSGGFTAGVKLNLSCRFNFHFEYEYQQTYQLMQIGSVSQLAQGFSLGVTYKFMKPDPVTGDQTSPFW